VGFLPFLFAIILHPEAGSNDAAHCVAGLGAAAIPAKFTGACNNSPSILFDSRYNVKSTANDAMPAGIPLNRAKEADCALEFLSPFQRFFQSRPLKTDWSCDYYFYRLFWRNS
jgi:hypothetical protein